MLKKKTGLLLLGLSLLLSACATQDVVTADGAKACVGKIDADVVGIVPVTDSDLLNSALGDAGEGKLCTGRVFEVQQPVTVYRVWSSDKSYSLYGSWWSFDKPEGPRQAYQQANDICPSWSLLDVMSFCQLKVGSKVVVGPGQSAECKTQTLPPSPVNQVYVPNDSRNNVLYVEDCSPGQAWP